MIEDLEVVAVPMGGMVNDLSGIIITSMMNDETKQDISDSEVKNEIYEMLCEFSIGHDTPNTLTYTSSVEYSGIGKAYTPYMDRINGILTHVGDSLLRTVVAYGPPQGVFYASFTLKFIYPNALVYVVSELQVE